MDDYYNNVMQILHNGTFDQIFQLYSSTSRDGAQGEIVRTIIRNQIYNIADRFDLIETRISMEDLQKIANQRSIIQHLSGENPADVLDNILNNPSAEKVEALIKALSSHPKFKKTSDLAAMIYIILKYTGTSHRDLLISVFSNPLIYLEQYIDGKWRSLSEERRNLLSFVAKYISDVGDAGISKSLKDVLTPLGYWDRIVAGMGYDPITKDLENMKRTRDLMFTRPMEIESAERLEQPLRKESPSPNRSSTPILPSRQKSPSPRTSTDRLKIRREEPTRDDKGKEKERSTESRDEEPLYDREDYESSLTREDDDYDESEEDR
jgi:hypothetical protein